MSIFKFKDLKSYLKSYFADLPKKGRGEVTRLAGHLGVSTTLISHVLSGNKSFTPEQAQKLISYLGLIGLEADYLTYLVQFERAGTVELRNFWKLKLEKIKEQSLKIANRLQTEKILTEEKRAIFYSSPLYMMLRLYTSVSENGKTLNELAQRFEIPMTKCSEIMSFLVECGLCNEQNGRYSMGAKTLHLEKTSPHLLRFQSDWRMRALSRAEDLSDSELLFTAPVSLSKKDFEYLREETIAFVKRFLETVHASPAEDVACLNIDLFWAKK